MTKVYKHDKNNVHSSELTIPSPQSGEIYPKVFCFTETKSQSSASTS